MEILQPLYDLANNLDYGAVTLLMAVESSFIPFPSEVVVPPAGYLAAEGKMSLWLVVVFATLGSLIGATINYLISYYVGRPVVYKFADSKLGHLCLLNKQKIQKAESYFDKHGKIATLVGRLIPAIRQLISIPAGLAKMNFMMFALYTSIGAGLWNIVLALLGYYLEGVVDREELDSMVRTYETPIVIGICLVVALVLLIYVLKVVAENKKSQAAAQKQEECK